MSPKLFARYYTEGIADYTYHFADAFVRESVAYVRCFDDGMTFEGLQQKPFYLEKSRVKKEDILMFKQRF